MNRIGLGCMGMDRRNEESSIRTVDTALDHGVMMFNVGEFYNGGESEIVLGNALRQHPRDKYFVSVKFGALPSRAKYARICMFFQVVGNLVQTSMFSPSVTSYQTR